MNCLKSVSSALIALALFISHTAVVFADEYGGVPNSRLQRLNARNANTLKRIARNSRVNTDFGFGSRKAGLNTIRDTRSPRNKTLRQYKVEIRRPSLRALHKDPVSRSRTERYKSGDLYENRLKKGLSVCTDRHKGRYERNTCIRKFTRGTRTFE